MDPLDLFFARRTLARAGIHSEPGEQFLSRLMHHSRQGHICLPTDPELAQLASALPPSILSATADTPVVSHQNRFYLQRNWVYETRLLEQVKRLRATPSTQQDVPAYWPPQLLPEQKAAITAALQNTFSIICGGPGTGKTYTAGFLVRLSGATRLALAAPTGKAAAHLEASLLAQGPLGPAVRIEVGTVHRLLRLQPGQSRASPSRKIDADLVLVDEASMLDVTLLTYLLEAIGPNTRLVLMGDPHQLPPIDAGSLFAEMATLFGTALKKSMRTEETQIHRLSEAIHRGDSAVVEALLADVSLETLPTPELFDKEPDPATCLEQSQRFRILGTLRQGPHGIQALNQRIVQEMALRIRPGQWWAIPILATHNEPRLDLYNGVGGILIGRCRGAFSLHEGTAYFPSQQGLRPFKTHPPFEVAFCLSVHKSQGSEFEHVLALFPPGSEVFGREALYTAVTRAKRKVELCVDPATLRKCLEHRCRRISGFIERF